MGKGKTISPIFGKWEDDLDLQDGSAADLAGFEALEDGVGFGQRVNFDTAFDRYFGGDAKKILRVLASEVGDAAQGSFAIDQFVGELRDGAKVDGVDG